VLWRGSGSPFLGEAAGVGKDDVDFGVAHLLQLVQRRVPGLDHDGGKREFGESLHLEGERSV
jgi:hypothetical protein